MTESTQEPARQFQYYDEDGVYIGKSEGLVPDEDLFNQAYYIFDDQSDIIKNLDILGSLHKRLKNLKTDLARVPMKDMKKIMELNRQIKILDNNIYELEKGSNSQKLS